MTGEQLLVAVAILSGPSYGVIVLIAMGWLWKRKNQPPTINVHYDKERETNAR